MSDERLDKRLVAKLDNQVGELENEVETLESELREAYEECDKLKKMWASFADLYEQFMIPVEGSRTLIKKLMVDLEIDNGYFPKEEK